MADYDELLKLGASKSSILRKLGLRARIDASAPNVSGGQNPTGMRRGADGFSEGWDQFFKFKGSQPRSGSMSAVPQVSAQITATPTPSPMSSAGAFSPQPLTLEPADFASIPNLTIERGIPPGFETGVAKNYLSAASRNIRRRGY